MMRLADRLPISERGVLLAAHRLDPSRFAGREDRTRFIRHPMRHRNVHLAARSNTQTKAAAVAPFVQCYVANIRKLDAFDTHS